ncbi:hypothetical protein PYCC9005_002896 [Savitreella phatthalungensis]
MSDTPAQASPMPRSAHETSFDIRVEPVKLPIIPQKSLCLAYSVFGLSKDPAVWQRSALPDSPLIDIHIRFRPEVLGFSPRTPTAISEAQLAKTLHAASLASFPTDVELTVSNEQPRCINHSFVLQEQQSTIYGVVLRVWSRADDDRSIVIREHFASDHQSDEQTTASINDTTVWIPYALCFLSHYPLYALLGSYIRAMWIHWSKTTNVFHAEEISRILSFPAPRLRDCLRIDMRDYALCYQFPPRASEFKNFDAWPLFSCLAAPELALMLETAFAPEGRVLLISRHLAMLNVAAEALRFCCQNLPWGGLFVPVAHHSVVGKLTRQAGPYIIGIDAACGQLCQVDRNVAVVDLDNGKVTCATPLRALARESSRRKFKAKLADLLRDVIIYGVPRHLQESYPHNQLTPEGQVIALRGNIETIFDPSWWDEDAMLTLLTHVSSKVTHNHGLKAITSGIVKRPDVISVTSGTLTQLHQETCRQELDANVAWEAYCQLEIRRAQESATAQKREQFMVSELDSCKKQFEKFERLAAELNSQSLILKGQTEQLKQENHRLALQLRDSMAALRQTKDKLDEAVVQRDDARRAQIALVEEYAREKLHLGERIRHAEAENSLLQRQRAEVESVLQELRHLITEQPSQVAKVLSKRALPPLGPVVNRQPARPVSRTKNTSDLIPLAHDTVGKAFRDQSTEISNIVARITAHCISTLDRLGEASATEAAGEINNTATLTSESVHRSGGVHDAHSSRPSSHTSLSEHSERGEDKNA